MNNPVGWFEIPVSDMERACAFYNAVFGYNLSIDDLNELKMALLPAHSDTLPGISGALVYHQAFYHPSDHYGVLIYFSSSNIDETLKRVISTGGAIIIEKRQISPEHGFMAVFKDSEGNRIALHEGL